MFRTVDPTKARAGLGALLCACTLAAAQTPTAPAAGASVGTAPPPLWEVGAFVVGAYYPAYPGSSQNLRGVQVLPYAVYHGPLLRVDHGSWGLHASHDTRIEWDLSGSGSFGGAGSEVRAREGMPAIGLLGEVGPALRVQIGDLFDAGRDPHLSRLELPLRAVIDASGGISYQGLTFEPRLTDTLWAVSNASVDMGLGVLAGDRRIAHLFYGVDPVYATATRPAYEARAGLIGTRLDMGFSRRLSSTVALRVFGQIESVAGAANQHSPLVNSRVDGGVGVSLTWSAWRSVRPGYD